MTFRANRSPKRKRRRRPSHYLEHLFTSKMGTQSASKYLTPPPFFLHESYSNLLSLRPTKSVLVMCPRICWLTTTRTLSPWRMNKASRGSNSRRSNTGKGGASNFCDTDYDVHCHSYSGHVFFSKFSNCCLFSEGRPKPVMRSDRRRRPGRPSRGSQRWRYPSMWGCSDSTLLQWVRGQIWILVIKPHTCTQDNPLDVSLVLSFYCISPQIFQTWLQSHDKLSHFLFFDSFLISRLVTNHCNLPYIYPILQDLVSCFLSLHAL